MRSWSKLMQWKLLLISGLLLAIIAACQGPPPTVYYIVLSPTPEATTELTNAGSVTAQTPEPQVTHTPTITPTIDPFPTRTVQQIQVAEQRFQHGRMFWLRPVNQIWVLVQDEDDPTRGKWSVYNDTWQEGQRELDPTIVPPEGLLQPVRGFGKLWRENPEIREALGWALELEFGHVTAYQYLPGGTVNANNEYVPGPGVQVLTSLSGEVFRFHEADGTWQTN